MGQKMILYNSIITIALLVILLNLLNNFRLLKPISKRGKSHTKPPLVSVLVPARNESENIEKCINSLVNQDYPNFELIVLDDNSEDDTLIKLQKLKERYPQVNVYLGENLPEGWTGKNFACHTLSQYAKGEWYLFTDSDTVHRKDSISSSVYSAIREKAKLLSIMPEIVIKTLPERLFIPIIHFALLSFFPLRIINTFRYPKAVIALGPFMLINAKFYRMIGGHENIKNKIVDDMRLAYEVKKHGGKTVFLDGKDRVTVRFYKDFKSFWNGFSKNSFGAFENYPLILLPFLLSIICLYIIPYLLFFYCLAHFQLALFPFSQILLITLHRFFLSVRFKINPWLIFLHPLSLLLWILIVLNSVRLTLLNINVPWKERSYSPRKVQ